MATRVVLLAMALAACGGHSSTNNGGAVADASAGADAGAVADAGAGADAAPPTSPNAYDHDGPGTFTTSVVQLTNAGRSWNEAIYTPDAPGPHPIVSLNAGTQQVHDAYDLYARRLASYGILTLVQDDEGALTPTPSVVADLEYVITTYVPSTLSSKADLSRVGLAGHSRGGKATLLAAEGALKGKVAAWFGLDPIDVDFTGTPGAVSNIGSIGIPLGFAGATVSSNCSPANANYKVYFASASAPTVAVTIEGAGHMQFEDEAKGVALSYCSPDGTADASLVLSTAAHYMTAFFARELLGDTSVGADFGGVGAPADVAAGRVAVMTK